MERKRRYQILELFDVDEWVQLVMLLSPESMAEYAVDLLNAKQPMHMQYILNKNQEACILFLTSMEPYGFAQVPVEQLRFRMEYARRRLNSMERKPRYQFLQIMLDSEEWPRLVMLLSPESMAEYVIDLLCAKNEEYAEIILKNMDDKELFALWDLVGEEVWRILIKWARPTCIYSPAGAPDRHEHPRPPAGPPDGSGDPPVEAGQPRSRPAGVSTRQQRTHV